MSTYIVRPSSVVTSTSGTTPSAPATVLSSFNDNSDTTFVYNNGTAARRWEFGLAAPTIAADEYVSRVGSSLRWKGSTNGNYVIGGIAYRATDTKPAGIPALYPNNSSVFTTTEVTYQNVAWSVAECSNLRMTWYDGRVTVGFPRTDTADIWSTIYTIKRATATSANLTSTASKPTFSVSTTATIDWEATSYDWQNLRKVATQVWVESGGTAPGTGTFVASKQVDALFTATGTLVSSIQIDTALPNGTYKFYTRAIRYREDGTTAADTTGVWSAAYTLTQNVAPPNTPTISRTSDQANDRVSISVTPVATSGYTSPTIDVERSDDGGATWSTIRGGDNVAGTFGVATVFYDYEMPRGVTVNYRANVTAVNTGISNTSAWTANQTALITTSDWNIKCPQNPAINVLNATIVGDLNEDISEDMGVFRPVDGQYPIIVSGELTGYDGDLAIITNSNAEWNAIKALIEAQKVLYLESPYGWAKYIRIIGGAKTIIQGTATTPRRRVTVSYVQTRTP